MERGPFLEPDMQKEFSRFVEILLHTDGRDEKYLESSQRNLELQKERFQNVSRPYYALLDPTGTKVYWEDGGVISKERFLKALRSVPESFR